MAKLVEIDVEYDQREISMMLNSLYFNIFTFFILKDVNEYRLFVGIPGETKQIGRKSYKNEKGARIAAGKFAKRNPVFEERKYRPIWEFFINPEKEWLDDMLNGNGNEQK